MRNLFTPWRYAYLSGGRRMKGCLFCQAGKSRRDLSHLVVHRGRYHYIILNRYPYNNGHLMIVPYAHQAGLAEGTSAQLREMMVLAARCETILKKVYRCNGLNLGMNLGQPAGAGIAGHLHLHVVPRWKGDTNFLTVVGGIRVIPESLETTRSKLSARFRPASERKDRSPRAVGRAR
jgi:ATP adenylyltransferase